MMTYSSTKGSHSFPIAHSTFDFNHRFSKNRLMALTFCQMRYAFKRRIICGMFKTDSPCLHRGLHILNRQIKKTKKCIWHRSVPESKIFSANICENSISTRLQYHVVSPGNVSPVVHVSYI